MKRDLATIRRIARTRFGIHTFRPGQEEAVRSVLAGRDTLVVMPTGSGKSAIYQLSALFLPGPTVVVSPLIALQRDQVASLNLHLAGAAAVVNSAIGLPQRRKTFQALEEGRLEYIFLAPEQLQREDVLSHLQRAGPSLFVVDEAHCISEWGHDFRPDYLHLGAVIAALGHPVVLALTATASEFVRTEIVARLGMHEPQRVIRGFDRPNITLAARLFSRVNTKKKALLRLASHMQQPAIVYVATHRHAQEIAETLSAAHLPALFYHGGMKPRERDTVQEDFMGGRVGIIVATSAFGMGVDKADVRTIIHYDVPDSLDAYYQEIGRAGRDGKPALAILFYCPADLNLHKFFAASGRITTEELAFLVTQVRSEGAVGREVLARTSGLSRPRLTRALNRLEDIGLVKTSATGEVVPGTQNHAPLAEVSKALEAQERRHLRALRKLERMRAYAEVRDCRRQYLLDYFGETASPCGNCDNCRRGLPSLGGGPEDRPFPIRTRVIHTKWGNGLVLRYEGDKILVLFDEVGEKPLAIDFVMAHHLLKRIG